MAPIQFDLKVDSQNATWNEIREAAIVADGLQFGTFWNWDHLLPIFGDMDGENHESYTNLAAFAAITKRIRLGSHVTGVMYRNPALQIKMATQLDVISNGRLDWGVGAAWAVREFRAFHIDFPEPKVRIQTLRETLDLAKLLWSADPRKKVTYEGTYVKAYDLFLNPQAVQRPYPPIFIGGGGEQLTLRVVARHADIWHGFGDIPTLKRKMGLIDTYAADYGRDGRSIVKSCDAVIWVGDASDSVLRQLAAHRGVSLDEARGSIIQGTPAKIERRLREYVDAGITRFIVNAGRPDFADNWRRISDEIIPRFTNG